MKINWFKIDSNQIKHLIITIIRHSGYEEFVYLLMYLKQGEKCNDCEKKHYLCKCNYCDDCAFKYCICNFKNEPNRKELMNFLIDFILLNLSNKNIAQIRNFLRSNNYYWNPYLLNELEKI